MTPPKSSLLAFDDTQEPAKMTTPTATSGPPNPPPPNAAPIIPKVQPDSGPLMKNYVALGAGADQDTSLYYGRISWFSVLDTSIPDKEFLAAAKELLPEKLQPKPIRAPDAFARTITELANWKPEKGGEVSFLRQQMKGDTKAHFITAVFRAEGQQPRYVNLALARILDVTPDGAKERKWKVTIDHIEPDHGDLYKLVEDRFRERYAFNLTNYSDEHVRGLLNRAIDQWDSYMARPTGGVYVVLERHAEELARVQAFVRRFRGEMWSIPLARTADSRDLILTTYEQQTVKEIEAMLPKMDEMIKAGVVEKADFQVLARRIEKWKQSRAKYETELEATMEVVGLRLEVAAARITELAPLIKTDDDKEPHEQQAALP